MRSLKKTLKILTSTVIVILFSPVHAQQTTPNVGAFEVNKNLSSSDDSSVLQDIKQEILNLGYFLGYPIDSNNTPPSLDQFFQNNISNVINIESSSIKQFISILSANVFQPSFIPTGGGTSAYSALNDLANSVLKNNQMYNQQLDAPLTKTASSNSVKMSPVSQMVLNLLSFTPDDACWASSSSGTTQDWNSNCNYSFTTSMLYAHALGLNISNDDFAKSNSLLGSASAYNTLANPSLFNIEQYFPQGQTNPQSTLLNQVDSSIFLSPLVYNNQNTGTTDGNKSQLSGLDTSNQLVAAESFLRNVTGTIMPPTVADKKSIDKVQVAISGATDIASQLSAFKNLGNYVLSSRIYAARESVALQNIYEIMSKRMPYDNPASGGQNSGIPAPQAQSSQALNEFIMASYRLYNPGADKGQDQNGQNQSQWQSMISTASSQNVEREMALLLAELNYQIYLMRQQQERVVLTNSLLLLNNLQYPTLQDSPN
jgi:intracellular multiplication protein IcmX